MKLIPNILLSCQSNAERRLFEMLDSVTVGPDWTAYHSLNCSEHAYKHWAEIDFLLVGPPGVLVLEVKGGRIRCQDGVWTYTDRYQRRHTSTEGPFVQARTAMYALRGMLENRFRPTANLVDDLLFGFGVVFPDIDWDLDTPEMPGEIVADRFACSTPKSLGKFVRGLQSYWLSKQGKRHQLNSDELENLRRALRPDVDLYPPFSARVGRALEEMQRLTDEQYERLEVIEQNERVVISGGAGTGKTFLMMQCARRERAHGRRVLVVVRSEVLAAHLRSLEPERAIRIVDYRSLESDDEPADVLFVDEGQDLLDLVVLAELSKHVVGGLDEGHWRWFMDENNQSGVGRRVDSDAMTLLLEGLTTGAPTRVPLLRNCRNTKEIALQVQLWTGADIGRAQVTGYGSKPELISGADEGEAQVRLAEIIGDLLGEGVPAGDIGIVLPHGMDGTLLAMLPRAIHRRLVPLDVNTVRADLHKSIVWGTVDEFKGLERPIIIGLGFRGEEFTAERLAELYVATTRGNYGLYLLADPKLERALGQSESRHLEELETLES